jgi:hypothetical protein
MHRQGRPKSTDQVVADPLPVGLRGQVSEIDPDFRGVPALGPVVRDAGLLDRRQKLPLHRVSEARRIPHRTAGITNLKVEGQFADGVRRGMRCRVRAHPSTAAER